nr:hypothetical protein [Tanacetum cinerariifolium]
MSLSKTQRLSAKLEALGERGDAVRSLDHMREIVAMDSTKLGASEQLLARAHVGMGLTEGYANGEIDTRKQDFNQWVLAVGNGTLPAKSKDGEDEPTWIKIPEKFIIKSSDSPIEQIVAETYPNFIERQHDDEYLKERAILTPKNYDTDAINAYMFDKLAGEAVTYNSADEICKASTETLDQQHLYPIEFLNTLNFPGMSPHSLCLKWELLIMLLRNVNPSKGLCNRT